MLWKGKKENGWQELERDDFATFAWGLHDKKGIPIENIRVIYEGKLIPSGVYSDIASKQMHEERTREEYKDKPIRIGYEDRYFQPIAPHKLHHIRNVWGNLASDYERDKGASTCVLGYGFEFTYEGLRYEMDCNGGTQGCLSWEHCKDLIEEALVAAGATNISYDWGRMD